MRKHTCMLVHPCTGERKSSCAEPFLSIKSVCLHACVAEYVRTFLIVMF